MSRIIFNLAAKCDAAGRSQNQDNYWVCPDLSKWNTPTDGIVGTDEDVELSEKGALLVVADGMGGMNAGEVASKLVIDGIKKRFSNIPDSILSNETEIMNFINNAIIESDESIKEYAKNHKDAEGLGSTIVLLWLLNGRAFCGWCGDSRIYRFNPNNELVRLSHDHSYVQSLVDEGKISEEEAFEHPDGNIISKALGDNGNKADPEIRVYDVYSRDLFLLCSDGLCGLLQDTEINDIIQGTCTSSKDSLEALWKKGEKAGWSDNATIDILCVVDGGKPAKGRPDGYPKMAKKPIERKNSSKPQVVSGKDNIVANRIKSPYLYILAIVAFCLLGLALYHIWGENDAEESTNHEYNVEMSSDGNAIDSNNANEVNISPSCGSQGHGKPQKDQKPNKTNGTGANGNSTISGNSQGFHMESQNHQPSNEGNGFPDNVSDQLKPSRQFMEAYDRVKALFNKTNNAIQTIKDRRGYMTPAERNVLITFNKTWLNNKEILKKEFNKAKEQQDEIRQFSSLNNDVEQRLRTGQIIEAPNNNSQHAPQNQQNQQQHQQNVENENLDAVYF